MKLQNRNVSQRGRAASFAGTRAGGGLVGWVPFPGGLCPSRCLWRWPPGTHALCPASAWALTPPSVLRKMNVHVCSASKLPAESSYSSAQMVFSLLSVFSPGYFWGKNPKPNTSHLFFICLCGHYVENKDGIITQRETFPLLYFFSFAIYVIFTLSIIFEALLFYMLPKGHLWKWKSKPAVFLIFIHLRNSVLFCAMKFDNSWPFK